MRSDVTFWSNVEKDAGMVQVKAFYLYMLDKTVKGMQIDIHTTCILVSKRLYYSALLIILKNISYMRHMCRGMHYIQCTSNLGQQGWKPHFQSSDYWVTDRDMYYIDSILYINKVYKTKTTKLLLKFHKHGCQCMYVDSSGEEFDFL